MSEGLRIVRRLGTAPAERGDCTSSGNCPDAFELEDGDFAVIGQAAADTGVPGTIKVVIPRGVMLAATQQVRQERIDTGRESPEWTVVASDERDAHLEQMLRRSAPLAADVAARECQGSYLAGETCAWYHGVWQYLRLLGVVSCPGWHRDFYGSALAQAPGDRVAISGCADYSMLEQVLHTNGPDARVTVIDRCMTPLTACLWYVRERDVALRVWRGDITRAPEQLKSFDVVTADAFLTRFDRESAAKVVEAWRALLADGGSVVTTVRIHTGAEVRDTEADVARFVERVRQLADEDACGGLPDLAEQAEVYARRMHSADLGSERDVLGLFTAHGFDVAHVERAEVAGELRPSTYLHILAVASAAR